jgi:hypothetical protein
MPGLEKALVQVGVLPYVDEHATEIAAGVEEVWRGLLDGVDSAFSGSGGAVVARAVGCIDRTASGPRPLADGSTIPGFHVVAAEPPRALVLEGRHRFSAYALIFRLEAAGAACTGLRAESRAAFPGVAGGTYRLLVVGTRGHVVAVRRLLSGVRRLAGSP